MTPFVTAGFCRTNDTAMSSTISAASSHVGNISSTTVCSAGGIGSRFLRNSSMMTGTVAIAPSSTAQKMLKRPSMNRKSMKSMFA